MSDGGGESERENEQETEKNSGGDDFGRAIAKIAVSQICEGAGFRSVHKSALETLTDIVIRYICDLGKTAHFYADLTGRTDCNVLDIIQGLEDLGSPQGFSGASNANHCIASSGVLQEIIQYVSLTEEIPFARPVPHFPVPRNLRPPPSFLQIGETPASKHIPAWLPAFPDPHTYLHTPVWNEREADPRTDKIEQARQRRKAERSLLSLQQRLACIESAPPNSVDPYDAVKVKGAVECNPFLASPLHFEERNESPVVFPAKFSNEMALGNHVSVLETFAPAIEAVKNESCDSGDGEKKVHPNKRPTVHFKFGIGKKSLGEPLDLSLQNKSLEKTAPWFGRTDDKDDKKRRAEQILKESMGNPQELAQL